MSTNIGIMSGITSAFTQGGIWMYAILAVHIVAIAIIAERVYSLYVLRHRNQKKYAAQFEEDIKLGRIDKVVSRSKAMNSSLPIVGVIQAGAQAAQNLGGREEIQAKMDEVLSVENARIEKRTGFLSMLGNVGTLLGLLGTIIGLIQAFASITNSNPAEKSELLTKGVALAMNTTAYGLIMAIPTLIMFAVLTNRSNQLQDDLNQAAMKIYNWLSFNYENTSTKSARSKNA